MNSLAHKSPIVEQILVSVLSKYPYNLEKKERHVIDTAIIPRIHETILQRENLKEGIVDFNRKPIMLLSEPRTKMNPPLLVGSNVMKEPHFSVAKPWESYKKILPILKDPFVSHIECKGPNLPLSVVKNNRTQVTNVVLSRQEIDEYLNSISEKTRLPLVEGVFHALVDDYSLNAVISNSIEPRFIIKKNAVGGSYGR